MVNNAQSDGKNKLKRIEFIFAKQSYNFILNPEENTIQEPNRVTVTQTKGGAFADDFGAGIPTIQLKGTTGFKNGTHDPTSGFKKFKELRDLIRAYMSKLPPGTNITSSLEMTYHNYTDGDHWIVSPETFNLYRSINRPHLYLYEIQLICLRPASKPDYIDNDKLLSAIRKLV